MYIQFYKKVWLGHEQLVDFDREFIDWKNIPPDLMGWRGSGHLNLDPFRQFIKEHGNVCLDESSADFKRFLSSSSIGNLGRLLDKYLDENIELKEISGSYGNTLHRPDVRELSRVLIKLAGSEYMAELY